ncbi:hypothetical protein LCGC14_0846620 [marine sediment metagenome]|uniref:Uncharacterized protein n=1 Tax=marine sediment metagenome TaxID=412755 RepID=A0A0F9PGC4_9ZZZZ
MGTHTINITLNYPELSGDLELDKVNVNIDGWRCLDEGVRKQVLKLLQ